VRVSYGDPTMSARPRTSPTAPFSSGVPLVLRRWGCHNLDARQGVLCHRRVLHEAECRRGTIVTSVVRARRHESSAGGRLLRDWAGGFSSKKLPGKENDGARDAIGSRAIKSHGRATCARPTNDGYIAWQYAQCMILTRSCESTA
jgi:hypothetical protein